MKPDRKEQFESIVLDPLFGILAMLWERKPRSKNPITDYLYGMRLKKALMNLVYFSIITILVTVIAGMIKSGGFQINYYWNGVLWIYVILSWIHIIDRGVDCFFSPNKFGSWDEFYASAQVFLKTDTGHEISISSMKEAAWKSLVNQACLKIKASNGVDPISEKKHHERFGEMFYAFKILTLIEPDITWTPFFTEAEEMIAKEKAENVA